MDKVMRNAVCLKQSFRLWECQLWIIRKAIVTVCKATVTVLAVTYLKFPSC